MHNFYNCWSFFMFRFTPIKRHKYIFLLNKSTGDKLPTHTEVRITQIANGLFCTTGRRDKISRISDNCNLPDVTWKGTVPHVSVEDKPYFHHHDDIGRKLYLSTVVCKVTGSNPGPTITSKIGRPKGRYSTVGETQHRRTKDYALLLRASVWAPNTRQR